MKTLTKDYQWRDRYGIFHYPKDMKTKHVFYTFVMLWNHITPKELRIWNNHRYNFPSFYTKLYIMESMLNLYNELKNRDNLGFKSKEVLNKIETVLSKQRIDYLGV